MIGIADTSFVLAVINHDDNKHAACGEVLESYRDIYLPQSTINEIAFMIRRKGGNNAVAQFIDLLPEAKYQIIPLEAVDFSRTAVLLRQYADSRIDFVDLTLVAIAERLDVTHILTLDYRDFSIVRPRHCSHFTLLPGESLS